MERRAIEIVGLCVGPLEANCYLLLDREARLAAVVDPGDEPERILRALEGYRVEWIVATHAHFDHVGALRAVKEGTQAPFWMHPADGEILEYAPDAARLFTGRPVPPPPGPDGPLEDGQVLALGDARIEVRHTPGHSPGSVSLVVRALRPGDGVLAPPEAGGGERLLGVLTGDALFAGSIGRTDLPGGDYETLLRSIRDRLLTLPDPCPVYPGHGPATTIGQERKTNPFLRVHPGA